MSILKGKKPAEIQQGILLALGLVYAMQAGEHAWQVVKWYDLLAAPFQSIVPLAVLTVTSLVPLITCICAMLPAAIKAPSKWWHLIVIAVVALFITHSGEFLVFFYGGLAGIPLLVMLVEGSRFLTILGPILLVALALSTIINIRSGGADDARVAANDQRIDQDLMDDWQDDSVPAKRTKLESVHLFLIRLTGIVMFAAAAYGAATAPSPPIWKAIAAFLALAAAVMFLSPRWTPRVISRPSRWYHFFGFNLLATLLIIMALLPYAYGVVGKILFMKGLLDREGIEQSPAELIATFIPVLTRGPSFLAWLAICLPATLTCFTMLALLFQKPSGPDGKLRPYSSHREGDMPEVKKLSKREQAARKAAATVDNGKLPTIGAAMKLYVATDWLMFRLLGVGLLGTGYLLWTFIEGERDFQATQLSYGFAPMHALYGYVAVGALMALPFMLPRFIVRPQNVIGGLAKAFLLVVVGLILLPMLHVGIDMFFDDMYRPTLHATVPNVFKALMGVSVTAALLISFFRQLGATPKMDYQGRVVREYSAKELADLRHARMPHD